MPKCDRKVHVLYATATGTAEDVAQELSELLAAFGVKVETCETVDDYPMSRLPGDAANGDLFIFIVATCGDGEVPVTMRKFWQFLRRSDLPPDILQHLTFAIFGLGDRAYVKFNAAARKLCTRLSDLGANLFLPYALGDDSADGGYDKTLLPWITKLTDALNLNPVSLVDAPGGHVKEPRVDVSFLTEDTKERTEERRNEDKWSLKQAQVPEEKKHMLFDSTVVRNDIITKSDFLSDEKEVRHVELDVSGSSLESGLTTYEPGDIIHILPRNKESVVDAFFELIQVDERAVLEVKQRKSQTRFGKYTFNIKMPCTLRDFVSSQLDLTATPRRRFFQRLAPFATNDMEKDKLLEFASPEGNENMTQYAFREKRTILMCLRDFPSARPPLDHLIDMIPILKTRPFSIASSSSLHRGRIHVCSSIVRYKTPLRFLRVGVCSSFLLRLNLGDCVPIFLEKGTSLRFHGDKPAILVGPGTGVAPMRSFLGSSTTHGSDRVLYFGCRCKGGDFLYEADWNRFLEGGELTSLIIAFSRADESRKVYVQHRMLDNSDQIWALLSKKGAYIYVAGSAGSMPKEVRSTIVEICGKSGKLNEEQSEGFVRQLEMSGRLQMECW